MMGTILSEGWLRQLSMKRLGCRWVTCNDDKYARRLVHPSVKALGKVWVSSGGWAGSHGNSHTSLQDAKRGVESDVAKAISADLSRLDGVLIGGERRTVISHLSLQTIEVGMEEAIVAGLESSLGDNRGSDSILILNGRRLPDGCIAGISNEHEVVGIAKPSIPATIRACLLHHEGVVVPEFNNGISLPFTNRRYSSLAELLRACEHDAARCLRNICMMKLTVGAV